MIVRPAPFPEELDRGYLGRVMRLNGQTSEKEAVTLMSVWAGVAGKTRREVSCLDLLSKVAGMELPHFVRQHTTLPLRRAVTSYKPDLVHGSEEDRSMLWTTGMRQTRDEAFFCPKCVQEDLSFHGQSFWRRHHQIPGLFWCQQHAVPLRYVASKSALLLPPSRHINQSLAVNEKWIDATIQNKNILKYLEICSGLLDRAAPLDVKNVLSILKEKASDLGYQTYGGAVKWPLLSDAVIEAFGRKWLATVLAALADKPTGTLLSQMDGVLYLGNSASSVYAYILASALLFDSGDAALNALKSPLIEATKKRNRSSKIESDDLVSAYVQARGNYSAAAKLLSVSRPELIAKLQVAGLPNLYEHTKQNLLVAAQSFFIEKQSLSQSAANGKIPLEMMEELARNAGSELTQALQKMSKPTGRGSGKRRAKKLSPEEARLANGCMAIKFSRDARREHKRISQIEVTEVQNVAQ